MEEYTPIERDMFMKIKDTNLDDKKPSFDAMKILGLRPKKKDDKYKKYAGLNRRMMASTIDTAIAAFTISPLVEMFMESREIPLQEIAQISTHPDAQIRILGLIKLFVESGRLEEFLVQAFALIIASAICWKIWSSTPGKMLLRMKIVDASTEQPISNKQILMRSLGYIPACGLFFLGIIWISFDKRRQGWHDKIADTVVIINSKKRKNIKYDSEILMEKSIETAASVS